MKFPVLTEEKLISRLNYPKNKIRAVMDTDTYNETDDQFAVVYALESSDKIEIEAFYAAPFHNELSSSPKDGMEKSYDELQKILKMQNKDSFPIYKGSDRYLSEDNNPVDSDAARDLVERALNSPDDDPLYVIAIGAITNIASAILMEPKIIEKIVVIWLGGHALHWSNTKEFNLFQDLYSSRTILDSGVPLVLIPCEGVTSHLTTTSSELRDNIKNSGEIGNYLYETFERYRNDKLGNDDNSSIAYSKVIWDLAPIGFLNNKNWTPSYLTHSPILSEDFRWSFDSNRHFIRYVYNVKRDEIFGDMFSKLTLK
ncbi:nucleoside hydrolase [Bacillus timonensis]|uniref:nucleoside hydrolase n=1 Tax=Bacillus timonensis TaxID=1033734 RepID=UPI000289FAA7|nr:nucleoside hydrolase [Bacillus timonensis]